jgi:hypothetical protein
MKALFAALVLIAAPTEGQTAAPPAEPPASNLPPKGAVRFSEKAMTAKILLCVRTGPTSLDCMAYEEVVGSQPVKEL